MLGKLLKHEWKQTWKLPTVICLATIAVSLIGVISFFTPLWDNDVSFLLSLTGYMLLFLNIFLLIASMLAILIYFSIRFYKNLYTDEGYLMHTLPVTSRQLIFSKFWVYFFWILISGSLVYACGTALMLAMSEALNMGLIDTFREIAADLSKYGWANFWADINALSINATGLPAWVMAILILLIFFVGICRGILTPYFAISVGQLFSRFKLAASIGVYIAILILQQLITTVVLFPINMSLLVKWAETNAEYQISYFYMLYAPQYVIALVLTVLFYFFTQKIMKKHLNLD